MVRIGVLALQGSVSEHMAMLNTLSGVQAVAVKTTKDLNRIDGIILPGGESTTLGKLLREFKLFDLLKSKVQSGMPVWGTCAGMILLAKEIENDSPHLQVMDIKVKRNAYGRQIDSFIRAAAIPAIGVSLMDLVFIRAPYIEEAKDNVEILLRLNGNIVAARQENMLVTSFHPELTDNPAVHQYFLSMAVGS